MSDSLPTDRKLEALESESTVKTVQLSLILMTIIIGVIKAEQSVKLAEVALLAASSQYELVMGIKAGKKGGGKGMKFSSNYLLTNLLYFRSQKRGGEYQRSSS